MKVVFFAGALRKESLNKKFVNNAADIVGEIGDHERIVIDLKALNMPVYDGDIEAESGVPKSILEFNKQVKSADAVIISSPEYNASIASSFKTLLDWSSRDKPHPWKGKPTLLLGASPGGLGAARGLWHGRQPLTELGTFLFPEMMGLQKADEAFDTEGKLKDPKNKERLKKLIDSFLKTVPGS